MSQVIRLIIEVQRNMPPPEARPPRPKRLGANVDLTKEDLQHVSEEVLTKAKAAMDEHFEANIVKPGDPGYEHDKRVDFSTGDGASESSWD